MIAIALAFVFGYSLTSMPLLRSGMTLAAVAPIALAGIFAFPLNRYLISRGRGHAVVHKAGIHS